MKYGKKIYWSIAWFVIGAALMALSLSGIFDEFWNGMGSGLVAVSVLQLIRHMRYRTDDEYREKMDVEMNDERNKYISTKAWAWAGYLFVFIMAVGTIVSKALGHDEVMMLTSGGMCLLVFLYWVSYLILRRKY